MKNDYRFTDNRFFKVLGFLPYFLAIISFCISLLASKNPVRT